MLFVSKLQKFEKRETERDAENERKRTCRARKQQWNDGEIGRDMVGEFYLKDYVC